MRDTAKASIVESGGNSERLRAIPKPCPRCGDYESPKKRPGGAVCLFCHRQRERDNFFHSYWQKPDHYRQKYRAWWSKNREKMSEIRRAKYKRKCYFEETYDW